MWTVGVLYPIVCSDGASSLGTLNVVLASSLGVSLGVVGIALYDKIVRFIHQCQEQTLCLSHLKTYLLHAIEELGALVIGNVE